MDKYKIIKIENKLKELNKIFSKTKNNFNDEGQIFFVGGFVRNILINKYLDKDIKIKDIDVATNLSPILVKKICQENNLKTIDTGIEYGTITILLPYENNNDKIYEPIEITTFRKDISTDGRRAEVEFARTLEEDLSRRDFKFNSIAINLKNDKIIDPNNGIEDIKNKKITFVGKTETRIQEDHLRVFRFFRFAMALNFNIEQDDINKIENVFDIKLISKERIKMELDKIILSLNKENKNIFLEFYNDKVFFQDINFKNLFFDASKIKKILKNILEYQPIENKENLLLFKYSELIQDIEKISLLRFSNIEIKKLKDIIMFKKFLSSNHDVIELKHLLNKIYDIELFKDYLNSTQNYNLLNSLNEIFENQEPFLLQHLKINGFKIKEILENESTDKDKVDLTLIKLIFKILQDKVIENKNLNDEKILVELTTKYVKEQMNQRYICFGKYF